MPEETINEAKQNQEQEVARNDKARAVIKALKEKFIKGNLSREEKGTFLESMHVLAPEKKEDPRTDLATFLDTTENPDKRRQAKLRLEEHAETNKSLSLVSDWSHAMPSRHWLLHGWIAQGRIAMLAGEGGQGKSWLLLQLAYGIASGNPIWIDKASMRSGENIESALNNRPSLNIAKNAPGTIVFASWEDESHEIKKRLEKNMLTFQCRQQKDKTEVNLNDKVGKRFIALNLAGEGPVWGPWGQGSGHIATKGELTPLGKKIRQFV